MEVGWKETNEARGKEKSRARKIDNKELGDNEGQTKNDARAIGSYKRVS
jgi:hypothetical protein